MKRVLILALTAAVAATVFVIAPTSGAAGSNQVRTCGGGTIRLKSVEKAILRLHNKTRRERGLKTLCVNRRLTQAARFHSREEIRNDYYSHCSKNSQGKCYEQWFERVRRFGFSGNYCCPENLHMGWDDYADPARIYRDWKESPGHWVNVIDPNNRQIGVGTFTGVWKGQPNTTAFSVDFGAR